MMLKKEKMSRTLVLTSMAAMLLVPQSIFAAGTGDNPALIEDVKTEKQIKAEKEKKKAVKEHIEKKRKAREQRSSLTANEITPNGIGDTYNTISMSYFEQETNYWCGPATTKQVLHEINGTSKSQSFYAGELGTTTDGTTFSVIDNVLNDYQSNNNYIYTSFASDEKDSWLSNIEWGIDKNYPTVLDLRITSDVMPKYTSTVEGHILNTSGYDYDDWELRLTDTFDQGNRGVTIGNTWHPLDGVWEANQNHFRKAMIW